VFDPLGQFDELRRAGRRMALDPAPLCPAVRRVVMPDIAQQQARCGPMDNQSDIVIDPYRPEVRVSGPIEPMEMQTRDRRIELQIECRRLDRFLLRPGQPREAVGEGVGDAEFHLRSGS
jgi:hypothetical protein